MKNLNLIFGILLLLTITFSLNAQSNAVQLCGKLEIIDSKLAKRLPIFADYKEFQQAMVFSSDENNYLMEIIYKTDDKLYIDRKTLTQSELDQLCKAIEETGIQIISSDIDQSGRQELLVSSTISGLGFYGWSSFVNLELDNPRAVVATYMLVGGSSFFVPFFLTKDKEVTKPMARAYSIGTGTGIGHGFLIKGLVDENSYADSRLAAPMAFGLIESIGLMKLTQEYDLSLSNVGMIATGSVWGAGYGATTAALTINENTGSTKEINRLATLTLLGSGAGMYAGHKIFQKMPTMTNGDVIVTNAYGILGGLYAGTAADLAFDDLSDNEVKITLSSISLLSAGGLAYGLHRTKDYNYSTAEASYIGLSEIAGGLLGIGVGYLVFSDFKSEIALVFASTGATMGLLLMDNFLRNKNMNIQTSIGNVDFNFNPIGVTNAFDKSERTFEDYQRNANNSHILSAKITF